MMDIRLPNITATDPAGQLLQIKNYLYQLVEQLSVELSTPAQQNVVVAKQPISKAEQAQENFSEIKSLIIKSADIVDAYYQEISKKLSGVYVAASDFGTYTEKTDQAVQANSTNITQIFSSYAQIDSKVSGIESSIKETNAYIKSGLLEEVDGKRIYGIEVGQDTGAGFTRFARFTAEKMSFYDQTGVEVAWVSNNKLFIKTAEVQYMFIMGGFVDEVQADRTIVTRWVG